MKTTLFETKCQVLTTALVATTLLGVTTACGPVEEGPLPPPRTQQEQAVESDNGLSFNGLSFNGLSFNGLSFNGLSFNGLSTSAFNTWFQSNPALASEVMRYVVRCAVPAGQTRAYTAPSTGQQYTWSGGLGLAPSWASGAAATEEEEQVVSACLAAHANRLGETVSISVLGRNAAGSPIPYTSQELSAHSRREACFFGNLFNGEGLFVGAEREPMGPSESSSRACAGLFYNGSETTAPCAPMVYVGACTSVCTLDPAQPHYFQSCRPNGVTYHRPITTRLRVEDIHKCGDTTCQSSERCGTSYQYDNCGLDCGACPSR
jgi:hypothetical protein